MNPLAALRPSAEDLPQPTRLLVVDDQVLYAEALSVLLRQQDCMEVVGVAADGQEAVELATTLMPDVVLMDIQMPRLDGIEATRIIRRQLPATKVVVMTALDGDAHVHEAIEAGAETCIAKFSHAGDLIAAIERVAA
jgi:DNA-binding NarL/FixJ family response regulator